MGDRTGGVRPDPSGYDLCVAQRLRQTQAGTAGADTILLSAEQQRALLYLSLDRVQRSMLGFTSLGNAFAYRGQILWPESTPVVTDVVTEEELESAIEALRMPILLDWAQSDEFDPDAKTMWTRHLGRDFAAAVELHAILSKEFTQMLARTASAREPTGMGPAQPLAGLC